MAPSRVGTGISRDRACRGIAVGLRMTARRFQRKSDLPFENRRHSKRMQVWMFELPTSTKSAHMHANRVFLLPAAIKKKRNTPSPRARHLRATAGRPDHGHADEAAWRPCVPACPPSRFHGAARRAVTTPEDTCRRSGKQPRTADAGLPPSTPAPRAAPIPVTLPGQHDFPMIWHQTLKKMPTRSITHSAPSRIPSPIEATC